MNTSHVLATLSQRSRVRLTALVAASSALLGLSFALVRPWYLGWGATPAEIEGVLPGDQLSVGPVNATRAIDIDAPASQVFAWVSQIGQNRAGFYSYTALENLVGCEMPNIRRLDPALQRWSVGERLWMYPPDEIGGRGHATLLYQEPGRALVFGTNSPMDAAPATATGLWSFIVEPTGDRSARLLVRGSGGAAPSLLGQAFALAVFEPLHFAMERRMLEGIKGLAEGHPILPADDALQLVAWFTGFALLVASAVLVLLGSHPERRLLGFAVAGVTFQIVTLLQPMPILSIALVVTLGIVVWPMPRAGATGEKTLLEQDT